MLGQYLNAVFNEDVVALLPRLPDESIDCIFADPDYNVGLRYNKRTYTKNFDEYIEWLGNLSHQFQRVLKKDGNLFIINYPKNNAYLRVRFLDNLFQDVFEYVWVYNTNVGQHPRRFTTAHRTILHCTKSKSNRFFKNNVAEPYKNPTDKRIKQNLANGSKGRMPYSWMYSNLVKNVSIQKTIHACQIPEDLSRKLILASTEPHDTVLIPFGGSGSEIVVCIQEQRNFVSAEIDTLYHKMILDRVASQGIINPEYRLLYRMRELNTNGHSKSEHDSSTLQPRLLEKRTPYIASPESTHSQRKT
jgi:DNA modification methylase